MYEEKRIAVLIDAENVASKYIKLILDEVSNYGIATYKRVYGDYENPSVAAWMKNMQEYALTPALQCNYTSRKSASDTALIIDAMDILYSGGVSGFCLVSSDSDFTKLALRLKEAGMTVIGMGEEKTPKSLVSACETFKYLDLLYGIEQESEHDNGSEAELENEHATGREIDGRAAKKGHTKETATKKSQSKAKTQKAVPKKEEAVSVSDTREEEEDSYSIPKLEDIEREILSIIETNAEEDGWINISELGINLSKRVPGFDPRNYQCNKLSKLLKKFNRVETNTVENPHNKLLQIVYAKMKE